MRASFILLNVLQTWLEERGIITDEMTRRKKRARLADEDKKDDRSSNMSASMFAACHERMLKALYGKDSCGDELNECLEKYANNKDAVLKLQQECKALRKALTALEQSQTSEQVRQAHRLTVAFARSKLAEHTQELAKLTAPLRSTLRIVTLELNELYGVLLYGGGSDDIKQTAREKCFLLRLLYRSLAQLVFL